jgi:Isochorismatase family
MSITNSSGPNPKAGLGALLTPDNCVLLLIDHQPFQFAGLRSHDPQTIINNVVGLTKAAKAFGVPTLFTTVVEDRGGFLLKQLQDVFPDQKPIDRTWINAWEDDRVVEWVKKTGRKKVVMQRCGLRYAWQCLQYRPPAKVTRYMLLQMPAVV